MRFKNRRQAGNLLAEKLSDYRGKQVLVLGLARGGVMIASEIGRILSLPVDVLIVKKIPSPGDTELAIGALTPDGVFFIDWKFAHRLGVDEAYVQAQFASLKAEIKRKNILYRKAKPPLLVKDKTIILADDGAATGATIEASVKWLKSKHAKKIIVALPVASQETLNKIKPEVNELVILEKPENFNSVGQFYEDFTQIADEKVIELLQNHSL